MQYEFCWTARRVGRPKHHDDFGASHGSCSQRWLWSDFTQREVTILDDVDVELFRPTLSEHRGDYR